MSGTRREASKFLRLAGSLETALLKAQEAVTSAKSLADDVETEEWGVASWAADGKDALERLREALRDLNKAAKKAGLK